jgi:hypothetical protein
MERNTMSKYNKSIAIIGAGPAGVTLANELCNQGYKNISLIDKAPDVGGQSTTLFINGHKSELATCYLSVGYRSTRQLIKSVGFTIKKLPQPTLINEQGKKTPKPKPPLKSIFKYLLKWYAWKRHGQIASPNDAQNALPFNQWLKKNNSNELVNDFTFTAGLTAQLYGPVEKITAYNGLQWMTPSLFLSGKFGLIYEIKEGFQCLWKAIVKKNNIKTILNTEVSKVVGSEKGAQVTVVKDGEVLQLAFDSVVVSTPLNKIQTPLSSLLSGKLNFDYTYAYSAIWKGNNWPSHVESRAYLPACMTGEMNKLLSARKDGMIEGKSTGQLVGYVPKNIKKDDVSDIFIKDFENTLGVTNLEIVEDRLWEYNIRYSPSQILEGVPEKINNAQGENNIWYTGGALSHWNVESIINFNKALARRMA